MVLRTTFLNKIRELNYALHNETKRVQIYRKRGGSHLITLPKKDKLEDDFVTSSLSQAGVTQEDIKVFMAFHTVAET